MELIKETTFDEPVIYKGLKIYPVKVKDMIEFSLYSECLRTDKNSTPDINVIQMKELEYLYWMTETNEKTPYIFMFDRLLSLVLKDDESFKVPIESITRFKRFENGNHHFIINDIAYFAEDYDIIKQIIAKQNSVELIDENISKDVRDSLENAKKYKAKLQKSGPPASIEDLIISLSITTGWSLEYIYNMTIRKFYKTIARMDNLIHYKIYLAASMSGMVDFKNKSFIKHWMSNLDIKDKYADVSVNLQDMQNKISPQGEI